MNLKIFCDGGARGNPGPAAVGVIIQDEKGKVLTRFGKKIRHATNNQAEYQGVVEAFMRLKLLIANCQLSIDKVDFFLDSKLVVNQLNGTCKLKNSKLRELLFEIKKLEQAISAQIFYHFIPREKNLAHQLVEESFK